MALVPQKKSSADTWGLKITFCQEHEKINSIIWKINTTFIEEVLMFFLFYLRLLEEKNNLKITCIPRGGAIYQGCVKLELLKSNRLMEKDKSNTLK